MLHAGNVKTGKKLLLRLNVVIVYRSEILATCVRKISILDFLKIVPKWSIQYESPLKGHG